METLISYMPFRDDPHTLSCLSTADLLNAVNRNNPEVAELCRRLEKDLLDGTDGLDEMYEA